MYVKTDKRWRVFWLCFAAALLLVTAVHGTTVNLIAYVTYSIMGASGAPLADGSYVGIFGSYDAQQDGPIGVGTCRIADSVTNDDVFIGWVRIDMPSFEGSNGTFYSDSQFSFVLEDINWLYIRFFDTTNFPIVGSNISWGTSSMVAVNEEAGYVIADFIGNFGTTLTNCFYVIPEPSSGHLLLLFLGMVLGIRASMKKGEQKS